MFILNEQNSIANHYLAEIRDVALQQDRMRFRTNLERLGEIMAYEMSKKIPFVSGEIQTPLARTRVQLMDQQPVVVSILRAGIPFYQGFCRIFDKADAGFIGAYRAPHTSALDLSVDMDYLSLPQIEGRQLILVDPMLASGKSMVKSLEAIFKKGKPAHTFLVSVIAAPEGADHIQEELGTAYSYSLWTCALDEKLDERAYIVPGLGDAGDLAFGPKI